MVMRPTSITVCTKEARVPSERTVGCLPSGVWPARFSIGGWGVNALCAPTIIRKVGR